MNRDMRLVKLSLPAKFLVTLFLLMVGPGYFAGTANIYFKHQYADDEPGLGLDDIRATFHGMTKSFKPDDKVTVNSEMLTQVRPDGEMREYLDEGGEPAIRGLIKWLENEAKEEELTSEGLAQEGDPSAQAIIKAHCVECHNSDGGDVEDIPFAETADGEPVYDMLIESAKPEVIVEESGVQTKIYKPISLPKLVQITHIHILTMPILAFIVGTLFMMTGIPDKLKLLIGPLPLLAILADLSGWWLARWIESFIYVIAASGGVFATMYGLQILCVVGSLWLGRTTD